MDTELRSALALVTSIFFPIGVDGWVFLNSNQFKSGIRWTAVVTSSLRFILLVLGIVFMIVAGNAVANKPDISFDDTKKAAKWAILSSSMWGLFGIVSSLCIVIAILSFFKFAQS